MTYDAWKVKTTELNALRIRHIEQKNRRTVLPTLKWSEPTPTTPWEYKCDPTGKTLTSQGHPMETDRVKARATGLCFNCRKTRHMQAQSPNPKVTTVRMMVANMTKEEKDEMRQYLIQNNNKSQELDF